MNANRKITGIIVVAVAVLALGAVPLTAAERGLRPIHREATPALVVTTQQAFAKKGLREARAEANVKENKVVSRFGKAGLRKMKAHK